MENKTSPALKIAILSNFTVKGLAEELKKQCQLIAVSVDFYEGGYGQINQEILGSRSGLYKFQPDITFLVINNEFVFPDGEIRVLETRDERTNYLNLRIIEFIETVNKFLENIPGLLVVFGLKQYTYSPLGINEDKVELSIKDWAHYFNERIKTEFIRDSRLRIYDFNGFFLRFGENNVTIDKFRYLGDIYVGPDFIPHLADDLMAYVKPLASKNRKCLVLDLDNTLWGGIIGEDGFNNIKLDNKPPGNIFWEFQKYILALHKRGVILAINSQNNFKDAIEVVREHPYMVLREENFACIKINWENKVNNLIEIAEEINVGLDSLIFVDDDPINRDLTRKNLPEVLVVDLPKDPSRYVKTLKQLNDLDTLQLTEEDFQKGAMYHQQRQRNELRARIKNLEDFLKNLDIAVRIAKATDFSIPRISQLSLKTNQFNLTAKKYLEEDIKKLCRDSQFDIFSVSVKDKFGDNGLTGVIVLKKDQNNLEIDTFLLSCRVIGRGVENAVFGFIKEFAKANSLSKIIGRYVPTEKNSVCSDLYFKNGFEEIGENVFALTNFNKIQTADYIRVTSA